MSDDTTSIEFPTLGALDIFKQTWHPAAMTRYRTILAYPCDRPFTQVGDVGWAPKINIFSSPDVDYLGVPTGTATENNAQALRDNMVWLRQRRRAKH